ncbi:S-layer domain-containing protein [[Leptolyngbya] sp. PCC 7376]|uniref:DUF3747 domain-containing protein n=1 Tax=[Leptolyngbya] sp. PCC 7376 TaxID=111781 RepID=UPI00029F160B|nr:DUF3747 domain-containing protein [[Leptolyngbya] sp. PCC 7376]AFY36684.1 S-layer domain-containing protein [[Leptolyngbya] sp. PCC 7376]
MFKTALPLKCLAIAATTVATTFVPFQSAQSQSIFGEDSINQSQMAAVAVPLKSGDFNLLVIEQFEGKRACWSESGSSPTVIDPLLLNFVFTSDCRRSTDSNGYSMRIDGEDLGTKYLLQMKRSENNVRLIATPSDRSKPEILIGQTNGLADDYLKIDLLPGWDFTRRTYENKPLGHFYFSADGTQVVTLESGSTGGGTVVVTPPPVDETPDDTAASRFTDIGGDIYRSEIEQAVSVGFIAGFNDNTFRPTESLTREQLVSMAIESLKVVPNSNIQVASQGSSFPDVASNRWSAGKIAWAQQNNIVSGYKDGTFRPTQQVTRAELMAILRRTAEYANQLQGKGATLAATSTAFSFVDLDGHWANDLTTQMSTYCNAATPYQESGDRFLPDTASQRNYAAAATLRTIRCATN